jgi:outer membrane protein assembly factor BamA
VKAYKKAFKIPVKISFLFALILCFHSCSFNKLLPADKVIVKKAKLVNAPKDEKSELSALIKQNPRQRAFGVTDPFLWTYLRQDRKDSGFISTSLKKLFGEKPIYLDTALILESQRQMQDYLMNKGYFRNSIDYTIDDQRRNFAFRWKHKAFVTYHIHQGEASKVNKVDYYIADRTIYKILESHFDKSLVKSGHKYDSDKLIKERARIAESLYNKGFFKFSKYYVYFEVDTTFGNQQKVDVRIFVQNPSDTSVHKRYLINNISIEPDYNIMDSSKKDSQLFLGYTFIGSDFNLKPSVFQRNLKFRKGDLYCIKDVKQSINQLAELQIYKFIDIDFEERLIPNSDTALLNCSIRLTPLDKQEWVLDLETNTTEEYKYFVDTRKRYYGMAGGLTYKHKNLFRQALQWTLGVGGAFDIQTKRSSDQKLFGNYQFDVNTALYFPYAFVPSNFLRKKDFISTRTALSTAYFFEENVDYQRATLNFAYTYQFNRKNIKYFLTPVEISRVSSFVKDSQYREIIGKDPLLRSLFDPHVSTVARYAFSFKNQQQGKRGFWRIRWNVLETAGNLPRLFFILAEGDRQVSDTSIYKLGNVVFSQYLKTDFEASYNYAFNPWSSFAARVILGFGAPFGNSDFLPFEKRLYIGGANSLRAWPLRGLGPGSYNGLSSNSFSQSGEIKFENNYEYRFDMFSIVKGAVFVDMGNVWTFREEDSRPGGQFKFDGFLSEIAIGTGFGIRFDFVYFILRFDFGIPMRDPSLPLNDRWVIQDTEFSDINFNIGIGYSF